MKKSHPRDRLLSKCLVFQTVCLCVILRIHNLKGQITKESMSISMRKIRKHSVPIDDLSLVCSHCGIGSMVQPLSYFLYGSTLGPRGSIPVFPLSEIFSPSGHDVRQWLGGYCELNGQDKFVMFNLRRKLTGFLCICL
jgi:hypothetical protein